MSQNTVEMGHEILDMRFKLGKERMEGTSVAERVDETSSADKTRETK